MTVKSHPSLTDARKRLQENHERLMNGDLNGFALDVRQGLYGLAEKRANRILSNMREWQKFVETYDKLKCIKE